MVDSFDSSVITLDHPQRDSSDLSRSRNNHNEQHTSSTNSGTTAAASALLDDNQRSFRIETDSDVDQETEISSGKDEEVPTPMSPASKHPREPPHGTKLQDQTNLLPMKQLLVVFVGLSSALFCSLLDQTIVSTALPTLGRVFNDADIASWVGTAYLLTSTACQPMYGRLSDIFGRKTILLASMGFFLLGSILCAVSQSMIMLIVFRALAGIGGGGILTSVMIVTSDVVSLEKRGKYQGILGMVVACSNSLGPLIGGLFSEKVSWRWCFYINIPLTSIAMLIVAFVLPFKRVDGSIKSKLLRIDYLGCAVMFASALLILIPLSWGGTRYAWDSAGVLAPLIIGLALLIAFVLVELKLALLPLIPMHIFKQPTVAGAMGGAFFTGFMFYCNLYYLPQFYQVVRGASAIRSGVLLLPLVLSQTITSFTAGYLTSKTGNYQFPLWTGFAVWTVASGLLSTITPDISSAKLVGYQILSGFGAGQTFQTSLVAIQAAVDRHEMAVATGTRNFLRMLGGTIALAACAAILNNSVRTDLSGSVDPQTVSSILSDPTMIRSLGLTTSQETAAILAYTHGIQRIYYLMIPCCGVSFLLTLFLVKAKSLKREDDVQRQAEGREWARQNKPLASVFKQKPMTEAAVKEAKGSLA